MVGRYLEKKWSCDFT